MNLKRKDLLLILVITGLALCGGLGWKLANPQPAANLPSARLASVLPADDSFTRADGTYSLSFPLDFGPHPDYQTEWWYYTGNLDGADGRHFGYQVTFFRRSIQPVDKVPTRSSEWATNQVYLAHFALSDVKGGKFQSFERIERGAAGLAGAQSQPVYQVWLDDWRVDQTADGRYQLRASQGGLAIDLTMQDTKGPIMEGDRGYSRKGAEPGNASYYYSQTHLVTQGSVTVEGQSYAVNGLSWMDHEFSTSALSAQEVGWDWFAVQLSDGSELMVYDLRRKDDALDAFSSGTFVAANGSTQHLTLADFHIQSTATWKSAYSQAVYPAAWQIDVPSLGLSLKVQPYLDDQEHHLTFTYWEGAVQIQGSRDSMPVKGSGYVELTGYAGALAGDF